MFINRTGKKNYFFSVTVLVLVCHPSETSSADLLHDCPRNPPSEVNSHSVSSLVMPFVSLDGIQYVSPSHTACRPRKPNSLEAVGFNQLYRGMCPLTCSAWGRVITMCCPHNFYWLIMVNLSFFLWFFFRIANLLSFKTPQEWKYKNVQNSANNFCVPRISSLMHLNIQ